MEKDLSSAKLDRKTVTDQVYEKIISYIKEGIWKIGEKLPSESELAELFNVNRLTVRLVLQKLNTIGVIETKNGIGTKLIAFDFTNYIDEASDFIMTSDLLKDITEYRLAIELPCIDLAIERATGEEMEELYAILQKYLKLESEISAESPREDFVDLVNSDIAFHKQIVMMSQNTLFLYGFKVCENVIFEHMMSLMKDRVKSVNDEVRTLRFHAKFENIHTNIYESMKAGDAAACHRFYFNMLQAND